MFIRSSRVSHGWNHKSDSEFFFSEKEKKSQSNSTVAGFRSTKINRQRYSNLKKHLTEFWGLKEQALQFEIGGFSLKLFRLTKSSTGKCESFALSNRWAVVTRTAKLNIWWRQQWAQLRACFLEFTTFLVCSENGSHASIPSSRAPEPNFSRVRLFPNVLTIV